jgi:hypothetical protein
VISISEEPFKDLEVVKADVRRCAWAAGLLSLLSLGFAAIGIIGEVLNVTLVLEPMSWFLLAIVAALNTAMPLMNSVVAKLLFGIRAESKKK